MNMVSFNTTLRAAITNYAPINVWAQAEYSKNHDFLSRADKKYAPEEGDCPVCALTPASRNVGQESREVRCSFALDLLVYDSSSKGFENVETYRKLIEDAVVAAIAGTNVSLVGVDVSYELDEDFPFLWCGTMMNFKETAYIGKNPLS